MPIDFEEFYASTSKKQNMKTITRTPRATGPFPLSNSPGRPRFVSCPGPRRRRASAFTLIETVVATFLAAIMLPAIYASTAAGFAMVQVTRENLRATQILLKQSEAIRLSPYKLLQDPA